MRPARYGTRKYRACLVCPVCGELGRDEFVEGPVLSLPNGLA